MITFNTIKQQLTDKLLGLMHGKQMTADGYQIGKVVAKEVSAIHARFEQLGVKANIDVANIVASDTGNFCATP